MFLGVETSVEVQQPASCRTRVEPPCVAVYPAVHVRTVGASVLAKNEVVPCKLQIAKESRHRYEPNSEIEPRWGLIVMAHRGKCGANPSLRGGLRPWAVLLGEATLGGELRFFDGAADHVAPFRP
jgi:hypothetical protein